MLQNIQHRHKLYCRYFILNVYCYFRIIEYQGLLVLCRIKDQSSYCRHIQYTALIIEVPKYQTHIRSRHESNLHLIKNQLPSNFQETSKPKYTTPCIQKTEHSIELQSPQLKGCQFYATIKSAPEAVLANSRPVVQLLPPPRAPAAQFLYNGSSVGVDQSIGINCPLKSCAAMNRLFSCIIILFILFVSYYCLIL